MDSNRPPSRPGLRWAAALRRLPAVAFAGAILAAAVSLVPAAIAAPSAASAAARLPADWRAAYVATGLPLNALGLQVREVDGDRTLAAWNADRAFVLASTTKVVTTMAALDVLGPAYRWRTMAFMDGLFIDGRLLGDLVIVGGGDARLTSDDMRRWLRQMRDAGLHEVLGDIVLDRFAFRLSPDDHAGTPPPGPGRPHHAWPQALTLNEGVLHVGLHPVDGRAAVVALSPALADVRVVNRLASGSGCRAQAQWVEPRGGAPEVVVRGGWSSRCGDGALDLPVPALDAFLRRAVEAEWRAAGGKLRGRVLVRDAPDAEGATPRDESGELRLPWSVHRSPPLVELVRHINKTSHNPAARNLMLSLVPGFPLRPATLPAAQERLAEWLLRQGLDSDDIVVDNGSGLSRAERGKPAALVHLLRNAWQLPAAQAFVDSLPVAGIDGTLRNRFGASIANGQAHLKTGSLNDARALAGYVRGRSGRIYALAVTVNHPNAARATPALDKLVEWVVRNG